MLQENGIEPDIVLYLENPPDTKTLQKLLVMLGIPARELLRQGEEEYRQLGLADTHISDTDIISAMSRHPKLIERPIVVIGQRAVIGRPPEKILEILP